MYSESCHFDWETCPLSGSPVTSASFDHRTSFRSQYERQRANAQDSAPWSDWSLGYTTQETTVNDDTWSTSQGYHIHGPLQAHSGQPTLDEQAGWNFSLLNAPAGLEELRQAVPVVEDEIAAPVAMVQCAHSGPEDEVVPEPTGRQCPKCSYTLPATHRGWPSDLKRHIQTHYPSKSKWFCCGVPVEQANDLALDPAAAQMCDRLGMWMVGGCGRRFTRRDAYKRHLDRKTGSCEGDANGFWFRT